MAELLYSFGEKKKVFSVVVWQVSFKFLLHTNILKYLTRTLLNVQEGMSPTSCPGRLVLNQRNV